MNRPRPSARPTSRAGRRRLAVALPVVLVALAACAPADEEPAPGADGTATPSAGACEPGALTTLTEGVLTVATDEPAYGPWFVDDDPSNGEGFESAVAYAVAEQLGYTSDAVEWVRVPFNAAIAPGPKAFDVDINQFSITPERREAVDFSSPYYDVRQAVVALQGSDGAQADTLEALGQLQLGAQVGTTSFNAASDVLGGNPVTFTTNDDAKLALENGQVDAIVVDLPTAFFITAAELEDGVIVGQLPESGEAEQFGMVLDLGSPLTDCVSEAVDVLREDGTLDELEATWLADVAGARELS